MKCWGAAVMLMPDHVPCWSRPLDCLGSLFDFGPALSYLPVSGNHWWLVENLQSVTVTIPYCHLWIRFWLADSMYLASVWLLWACLALRTWLIFTILSASQSLIFITVYNVEGCCYLCCEGKGTSTSNSARSLSLSWFLASGLKYLGPDFWKPLLWGDHYLSPWQVTWAIAMVKGQNFYRPDIISCYVPKNAKCTISLVHLMADMEFLSRMLTGHL